jgi:hypothetical protein
VVEEGKDNAPFEAQGQPFETQGIEAQRYAEIAQRADAGLRGAVELR